MAKPKRIHGRQGARWAALQGLYAWQLAENSTASIEADLLLDQFTEETDQVEIAFNKPFLHELLTQIPQRKSELDELLLPYLDRALDEVHPVEHAILWIAAYELKERLETPYKVILNEAIILAKEFGAQDSHKFVNGVLDKAGRAIRSETLVQIA